MLSNHLRNSYTSYYNPIISNPNIKISTNGCNNGSNEKNKQEQSHHQNDKQQLSTKEKIEHLQQNLIVPSSINSMIIKAKLAILV
jgi:hypothetical protein